MNKREILENALKRKTVTIDGLGEIELRELSAEAMADYLQNFEIDGVDTVTKLAKMCQLSIVEGNDLTFADNEIDEIKGISFSVLNEIQKEILPLNNMGEVETAQEK